MVKRLNKTKVVVSVIIPAILILAGIVLVFFRSQQKKQEHLNNAVVAQSRADEPFLKSFFDKKSDYEDTFLGESTREKDILVGIISHHFLAKKMIARFFLGIGNSSVKKVILVSPDHYGKLDFKDYSMATTELPWETPYGNIFASKNAIQDLLEKNIATINDEIFYNEHSIYTLVPFIKRTFPDAEIIPLIVKNSSEYAKIIEEGGVIKNIVGKDSIMIVSSDFSHNRNLIETKMKDVQSIQALSNFSSVDRVKNIECDCKTCMALAFGFLGSKNNFYLSENKNSNDFGPKEKTVTSYVSGYFLKDK